MVARSGSSGVYGATARADNSGVMGFTDVGVGLLGQSTSGIAIRGQVTPGSSANTIAMYGVNNSTYAGPSPGAGGFAIYGLCANGHGLVGATATAGGAAVVGATNCVTGTYAGAFYGPVAVAGAFTVFGGPKSAAVPHPDGTHRRLYCMESPESWFEDFGERPGLPICTDGGRIHSQLGSGLLGPIRPGDARPDIRVDVDPVYRFGRRFS